MAAGQLQVIEGQQQPVTIEYVPSVAVTLEQAAENLRKLDQIRQRIMRQGTDYDVIPGTPKPTLLKPGAERLLQFFGLGHRVECVNKVEDWDNGFFYYVYRATVIKQYPTHTIVVAECEGSANSKEKRYRNQDVFSIVNTLQKMAIKRALVGATLQATGTSGFFTQDLDDMDLDVSQGQGGHNEQRRPAGKSSGESKVPHPKAQVVELMKQLGFDWNALAEVASDVLGRPIKKVISDIKTNEEWQQVADVLTQMLSGKNGQQTEDSPFVGEEPEISDDNFPF